MTETNLRECLEEALRQRDEYKVMAAREWATARRLYRELTSFRRQLGKKLLTDITSASKSAVTAEVV